jgi:hypothetical protein
MDTTACVNCIMLDGNGSTVRIRKSCKCDTQSFSQRAGVFVLGSRSAIWIGIGFELKTSSRAHLQWSAAKKAANIGREVSINEIADLTVLREAQREMGIKDR